MIDNTGDVGIGTTSPSYKLDVSGTMQVTGDVYISDKIIHISDTNTAIRFPSDDTVTIETGGSERLIVNSSGNVGIGESSPGYKLEVSGTFAATRIYASEIGGNPYDVVPAYSNSDYDSIRFDTTESAMCLQVTGDSSIGMAFPSFRVNTNTNENHIITLQIKGSIDDTDGVYIRVYEYDSELPSGKTHVSATATNSVVQEATRNKPLTPSYENQPLSASWETITLEYAPTITAVWASVVVLKWSTILASTKMFVRDLKRVEDFSATTVGDADTVDTLHASQFVRSDVADAANGTITFNDGIIISSGSFVTTNSARSRDKIRVWTSANTYCIGMDNNYTFGGLVSEYAMTFQMNNSPTRGFWWGNAAHTNAQGAMALTTDGNLTVAQRIRVGYGESDTTSPISGALQIGGDMYISDKIIHNDDPNTAIRFPSDDTVTIETGGNERLRVDSSGRVAIGTTSATRLLQVKSTLHSGSINSAIAIVVNNQNGTYPTGDYYGGIGTSLPNSNGGTFGNGIIGVMKGTATSDLALIANGSEYIRVRSDGNVGIGTTNPLTILHVVGPSVSFTNGKGEDEGIFFYPGNSSNGNGGGRIFFKEASSDLYGFSMGYVGNNVSDTILNWPANTFNMSVHSNNVTGSIVVSIDRDTGNLSMGTVDTTNAKLTINAGGTYTTAISFENCDALKTTSTSGRTLEGYLKVYIDSSVTGFTSNDYYIPVYS